MTKMQDSSMTRILLACSVIMNVFLMINLIRNQRCERPSQAAEEVEGVASISCSGHGRAFLDGLLGSDGKPVCECNACFRSFDCSDPIPYCEVDADSGDPMFLEPFWLKNAASSVQMIPGWHRMSYEFSDGSLISEQLKVHIERLHGVVGNANTKGRYIIFGGGATHLLNAAVHALSSASRVVASVPYYPVYKEQTEFFKSKDYKFSGDTFSIKGALNSSENYIELVTSPNNPDGQLKKAILKGESVKTIHDLAYYWPHFTSIPAPLDQDLMIFTLSKLTGHAGSRFGWAVIKDKAVYERMLTYMSLSTYGVPRETQLRVLKLLKVVLEGEGREMFDFGFQTMRARWTKLSKTLSVSTRFSLQQIEHQYCSFSRKIKGPSPAFAWIKCLREEDKDCYEILKSEGNVTGRRGSLFGAENGYVRLSLVKSQDDFSLLHERIQMLVNQEIISVTT
ncbi:tryptophan aminotransferase-related protein 4-like [Euphorbia lathyris]|uniref:tryptophan aminotransferase-related protein 4-like n=1 Tax=Euphorbia lathyris TaxID=212925 RepID=UPI003313B205